MVTCGSPASVTNDLEMEWKGNGNVSKTSIRLTFVLFCALVSIKALGNSNSPHEIPP